MKATFHCSTLEQARDAIRFAHKEGMNGCAEVVITLECAPVEAKWTVQNHTLKNDTVDALLPLSFFGARGTKYLNDANKGKGLAFRVSEGSKHSVGIGVLECVTNGDECMVAVVLSDGARCRLEFDIYDFLFLE